MFVYGAVHTTYPATANDLLTDPSGPNGRDLMNVPSKLLWQIDSPSLLVKKPIFPSRCGSISTRHRSVKHIAWAECRGACNSGLGSAELRKSLF